MKQKGEKANEVEKGAQAQIQDMMADIENEFDEIEALMRDVDTLKIQGDPTSREHEEERISNAPTDWHFNLIFILYEMFNKIKFDDRRLCVS